jgi:hypothetical protein
VPAKRNNDDSFELIFGISFGILAIIILAIILADGNFSDLFDIAGGVGRGGGIPILFIAILGLVALYYAIKKIIKANNKKNDT